MIRRWLVLGFLVFAFSAIGTAFILKKAPTPASNPKFTELPYIVQAWVVNNEKNLETCVLCGEGLVETEHKWHELSIYYRSPRGVIHKTQAPICLANHRWPLSEAEQLESLNNWIRIKVCALSLAQETRDSPFREFTEEGYRVASLTEKGVDLPEVYQAR